MSNMGVEMLAFTLAVSGWILISSTIPTDYWKVSSIDGTVITTATFWSNLWKTCVTDSTGVSNCKDFPSMLALEGLSSVTACSLYAHRITSEFFDPTYIAQKYELGAALFIGWAGSALCILGGIAFCFSMAGNGTNKRADYTYSGAASFISSRTKVQNMAADMRSARGNGNPPKHFDKNAYV
ncbi:Claudin-10 [Acipenser ruthenus]|uniref:Claudin n=1 Tax=Acipenser ruthenus TaxID=7906 RepID=A0A444UPM2_ACIRT|nr:Claudin-10 [Acipenser ruthenus]